MSIRRLITLSALAALAGAGAAIVRTSARAGSIAFWVFENVSAGNLVPGCVSGAILAGFEFDPDNRPTVAWREENGAGIRRA